MAIEIQGQAIFKKVALSEKKMILREMCFDKMQLSIKGGANEDMFHLIAIQNERDEILLCHHTVDSKDIKEAQKAIVNFSFKTERYFFQADLYFEAGWVVLKIESDLFQLHRRANARINIPDAFSALFIITQYAGKAYFLDCKIKDISAGGFKLELPSEQPELIVSAPVKGILRFGKRRPIEVDVEIRFVQKWEKDGLQHQVAGAQFLNVNQVFETRMLSLVMDLQHEFYLKYQKRK